MDAVHEMMQKGADQGVFPGGVLLVSRRGRILFHAPYGVTDLCDHRKTTTSTVFDLASLTKPLATTPAVMKQVQAGAISLDQRVASILPEFQAPDRAAITVQHLLDHTSGLPDYVPFYKDLNAGTFFERQQKLRSLLAAVPLRHPPGEKTLYSDLGFMVLNWAVSRTSRVRLDAYVAKSVYRPLGLDCGKGLFFRDLDAAPPAVDFAATEVCPWRSRTMKGEVHDENAWAGGGIEGHAGLFGSAEGVHRMLFALLSAYHDDAVPEVLPRQLVRKFLQVQRGRRPLGFDTPDAEGSSAGNHFSANTVGHLGFTGTSFWMDLDRFVIVILLTNRIHPSRENSRIKAFRPCLHDAVMTAIPSLPRD